MDTSGGGEPREEWRDEGEIGVGGVSGDEGVFNSGKFSGVSGEGEQESGSGISVGTWSMLADEMVDREADGLVCDIETVERSRVTRRVIRVAADSMFCDAEAVERSPVTCRVVHVETGNLEAEEVRRLSSLAAGMRDR
jgi:hypothetical protein